MTECYFEKDQGFSPALCTVYCLSGYGEFIARVCFMQCVIEGDHAVAGENTPEFVAAVMALQAECLAGTHSDNLHCRDVIMRELFEVAPGAVVMQSMRKHATSIPSFLRSFCGTNVEKKRCGRHGDDKEENEGNVLADEWHMLA